MFYFDIKSPECNIMKNKYQGAAHSSLQIPNAKEIYFAFAAAKKWVSQGNDRPKIM